MIFPHFLFIAGVAMPYLPAVWARNSTVKALDTTMNQPKKETAP